MTQNLILAIRAAIHAGKEILKIYDLPEIEVEKKNDNSPLTKADMNANRVINKYLWETGHPIISEENKQLDFSERKNWATCWMVDPLDGTKEFIKRTGEFTVNIAFCDKGRPILGVIYVPVSRKLYFADVAEGKAYKKVLDHGHDLPTDERGMQAELFAEDNRIYPNMEARKEASQKESIHKDGFLEDSPKQNILRVVGSRSHMNKETSQFIDASKAKYETVEIISRGSSLKFCLVAEGEADVYPRFAPTMEWDTAAGHAICSAVGLQVIAQDTQKELVYNKENLLNPHFLVGTSARS
ncbi:MAG: 3'(2'),5'-bisphosphate nucleotidase CysQ [Pricia sp.]